MVSLKKIIFIIVLGMIFTACGVKEYTKQSSVFIVFKTPAFKHADLGFIYENSEAVKVEIYGSGKALVSLELTTENICMSLFQCMSKEQFNRTVLSSFYPPNILQDIFQSREIFKAEGIRRTRNGFTQQIVRKNQYNIHYSVLNKQIVFRDTINDILIKVKRLD